MDLNLLASGVERKRKQKREWARVDLKIVIVCNEVKIRKKIIRGGGKKVLIVTEKLKTTKTANQRKGKRNVSDIKMIGMD
ncbi:hypothetical protein AVEN_25097-1 [Araneus ventricosus]|uniref:Uncharacterized protein n=1 Tax=Araneus ventricosus TaxID=182803 RepID=A0A4Y2JDY3_ARAVE|nr:hypothetical protein AVEN_25097-1 [Araneus ventricosus]